MSEPDQTSVARRLAAQLELERSLHGLLVHELGNPLQSLLVLIELSRDELHEAGVEGRPVERLDRALTSVERLRHVLLTASRMRVAVGQAGEQPSTWGQLLDDLLGFIRERVTQLRASLARSTEAIDDLPLIAGHVREATLGLLLGACRQIREIRSDGATLELHGQVLQGRVSLRVGVRGPEGHVELDPGIVAAVDDLLADDAHARCQRDGRSIVIGSA